MLIWLFYLKSYSRLSGRPSDGFQGFTLLELMISTIIAGMLAMIAIPTLLSNADKAKYANAKNQMGCMATELRTYALENGNYPGDQNRNTAYTEAGCFEVHSGYVPDQPMINQKHNTTVPFGSVYDYESWNHGSGCYIAVTFFGRNGLRKFTQGAKDDILTMGLHTYDATDDDLVFLVDITASACALNGT